MSFNPQFLTSPTILTEGQRSTGTITSDGRLRVDSNNTYANLSTYTAQGTGYTAYATPTDLLTIKGSDSKIIRILQMRMLIQTTSGALQSVYFVKRSTANTGGTSTTPTGIPLDSSNSAATATLNLYTAAPTLGTSVGTLGIHSVVTTVTTAAPAVFQLGTPVPNGTSATTGTNVTLRGSNELLAINWNGAALPAGFTASWDITWTESTI